MYILLLLLSLLFFSSNLFLLSSANSITLSLSPLTRPPTTGNNPWNNLKYHAAASLARTHHLKHVPNNAHIPLYPLNHGNYTVALSFGTPPQTLNFTMDTGTSFVWFPCTNKYPTFIPKNSSSYKEVTCNSQQCGWIFPDLECENHTQSCMYLIEYDLGFTTGVLLSESLTIPGLSVPNFTVGCSVYSDHMSTGIVGFGRDRESLPVQLGLKAFSYCLVSHNTTSSSDFILTIKRGCGKRPSAKIHYTPFVLNPVLFPDYYYVWLQNISISSVDVKVPAKYLVLDKKGNGGTIVDLKGKLEKITVEQVRLNKKSV